MKYRLTGAQDPADRIDRVEVEGASDDFPEGKVLELNGDAVELSDEQVQKLSPYVKLEPVKGSAAAPAETVDQPGVDLTSQSTAEPPDPGTVPEISSLNKDELVAELGRVRVQEPGALPRLSDRSNVEELKRGLRRYHNQEA